jgi:hypothetical protein
MRLNLGCGFDKRAGFVNVDKQAACEPDQVVDLEHLPWPWPDDAASEVVLRHTLEHLGARPQDYLDILRELWRICRGGATVSITVPHPRHDSFLNDPTHVRVVTPQGLELFSQAKNREWRRAGVPNTPLGLYLGIDFAIQSVQLAPDEPWAGQLKRGEIKPADLHQAMRQLNNVIAETTIVLKAIKPAGG